MQSATIRLEPRLTPATRQQARRSAPARLPPGTAELVNRLLEQRCGTKAA